MGSNTSNMVHSLSVIGILIIAALATSLPTKDLNIVQLASQDPELSTLVTALTAAKLVPTFSGDGSLAGPFTVFAPTNKAFSLLPKATLAHLLEPANIQELQAVLDYHVLAGAIQSKELKESTSIVTLEGSPLVFQTLDVNVLKVNDALVIFVDLEASNGVVHVIDHVLMPPAKPKQQNIFDRLVSIPELSTFVELYSASLGNALYGYLNGPGPMTVLVPTNEAFAKLPKATLDRLSDPKNIGELQNILEYHVVNGVALHTGCNFFSAEQPGDHASVGRPCGQDDLETNSFVNTLQGQGINVGYGLGYQGGNGTIVLSPDNINYRTSTISKVISVDVQASNGIIHVIDNVLIPPTPTRTILKAAELSGYTTFITALKAANLTAALDGNGPLTVFVPSNEAFAKLPKATLDHLLEPKNIGELQDILKYHVIAGGALRAGCNLVGRPCGKGDLESAMGSVKTLEGKAVTINQRATDNFPTIVIDKSTILPFFQAVSNGVGSLDQIATNGIWHVIDQVLIPTTPVEQTLNQLIASKPNLSTFATALKAGLLTGALDGQNGQLTVFAPSNEAFAKLPKATLEHLLDPKNIDELQSILEYHVIGNTKLFTRCTPEVRPCEEGGLALENLSFIFTLQSDSVSVDVQNGVVVLSPDEDIIDKGAKISKIVQSNLGASNGVVHVIDKVLIPPAPTTTIFDAVENNIYSTFIAAVKACGPGFEQMLKDTTHGQYYTVFVPSEAAFARLGKATLDHLLDPKNIGELQEIIGSHIQSNAVLRAGCKRIGRPCNGPFSGSPIFDLESSDGINGLSVTQGIDGSTYVDKSKLVPFNPSAGDGSGGLDNFATNGIWHVIDQVLMPDFTPYFP